MDLPVKVVFEMVSPSFVGSIATADTVMLYQDPGIKLLMIKEVSLVLLLEVSSPKVHRTLYEVALPTGTSQCRDTDDVVTSVMLKFPTRAGSAQRKTG